MFAQSREQVFFNVQWLLPTSSTYWAKMLSQSHFLIISLSKCVTENMYRKMLLEKAELKKVKVPI
jgi:hypothetical protein